MEQLDKEYHIGSASSLAVIVIVTVIPMGIEFMPASYLCFPGMSK